ncbi:serine/threonine protein kinase [Candidatus Woesearchaeota archaeon]|nr:serine/threonine protein kinase [Candidatus Woesearchaeota archaeon]
MSFIKRISLLLVIMGLEEEIQIPDYKIVQEAGRGNFGIVYKAREISSGRDRAIKILDRVEGGRGDAAYALFRSEGLEENESLADAFQHENLVRFYRQGVVLEGDFTGQKFIVLEWVQGTTLEHASDFSPREIDGVIKQICHGVQHMHERGYLHNDIRAPNIMVTHSQTKKSSLLAKLGDYTLVTPCDEQGIASAAANISSRTISAPESIQRGELSARTDIWGLGILMYQLWTGEHPFPHSSKDVLEEMVRTPASYTGLEIRIQRNPQIPQKYKAIIQRCLSYNPDQRYQSVTALLHELEPPKTRLSVGSVVGGIFLAALGCLGISTGGLLYFQKPDPIVETKTEVQYIPTVFSDNRKVKRDPRIQQGVDPEDVCNHPEKYHMDRDRYKDPLAYRFCLEFGEAKKLLDQAEFVAAAKKLEALQKDNPLRYEPPSALLEAYYELGLVSEAAEIRKLVVTKFGEYNPMELALYSQKIDLYILDGPTTVDFLSRDICTVGVVQKNYPECPELVLVRSLSSSDEKEKRYAALVRTYSRSFLVHREYARFLFETNDSDKIPLALQQYEAAAKLAKNRYAFFAEITHQFEKRRDFAHAFVYQYRAEEAFQEGYSSSLWSSRESDALLVKMGGVGKNTSSFTSKEEAYHVLSEKCTADADFGFVPCSF